MHPSGKSKKVFDDASYKLQATLHFENEPQLKQVFFSPEVKEDFDVWAMAIAQPLTTESHGRSAQQSHYPCSPPKRLRAG